MTGKATTAVKRPPWKYDPDAVHGWIVFREGKGIDYGEAEGLIGTSEWAWAEAEDLKALTDMMNSIDFVAPSEIAKETEL